MGLHPQFSPYKVACLPLSKKPDLQQLTQSVFDNLAQNFDTTYDESGSIGKRYRRQDEIGTPLCVTIDFDSLEDQKVTIRHRDSMKQDRVSIDQIVSYVNESFLNWG